MGAKGRRGVKVRVRKGARKGELNEGANGEANSEAKGSASKGLSDERWVLSCCWGCCGWEVASGLGRWGVSLLGGGGGG